MEVELNEQFLDNKTEPSKNVHNAVQFREKEFRPRNSPFTDLFNENKSARAFYHMFMIIIIHIFVYSAVHDYLTLGKISTGYGLFYRNFIKGFPDGILVWLGMQTTTALLYFGFLLWFKTRTHLKTKFPKILTLWDCQFLTLSVIYQVIFLLVPPYLTTRWDITESVTFGVVIEQLRFMMKSYSFLRVNIPRVRINNTINQGSNDSPVTLPRFGQYFYFLFAPTLIYKDEYPRTAKVHWSKVLCNFTEFLVLILFGAILGEKFIIPSIKDFGKTKIIPGELAATFFSNALPMCTIFVMHLYAFHHSWMNAWAEMLRFADRKFYLDWWNSSNLTEWFRNSNSYVHEWLYAYIYKDATLILKINRNFSIILVLIISGVFHEYFVMFPFKFFFPGFLMVYLLSILLFWIRVSNEIGNILLLLELWTCTFAFTVVYVLEYYARLNCPPNTDSAIKSFFIPVIFSLCNQ